MPACTSGPKITRQFAAKLYFGDNSYRILLASDSRQSGSYSRERPQSTTRTSVPYPIPSLRAPWTCRSQSEGNGRTMHDARGYRAAFLALRL